jgi:hypothetical protein
MAWKPSFASVSTRNDIGIGTLPTYNALGGPFGKGHASFYRTNSQPLSSTPRLLNSGTNGGLTIVVVWRWTGQASESENLINIGGVI